FSARWTGILIPPKTGIYRIGATTDDGSRLYLNEEPMVDDWHDHAPQTHFKDVLLFANRPCSIKMEYYENAYQASAKLVWIPPDVNPMKQAVDVAKHADVVIAVMGISQETEGETYDKKNLNLPDIQEKLLKMLHKTGKPIVLVLINGSPLSINWVDKNIPAILEAWYPGEEGGTAVADVIFGDYNPGGRLPITFCKSIDQVPPFENYNMRGRTYRYMKKEPLYPFGYGLSFTRFKYSELNIQPKKIKTGGEIAISVRVKNIGKTAGDEVAQLYISDLKASAPVPILQLAGFRRIHLKPNQEKVLEFRIKPDQLAFFDYDNQWVVEPGEFEISVGGCHPAEKYEKQTGARILKGKFLISGEKLVLKD
ncbi:glycoside hydrolase family 3 C-terminal domain-containing protein, partial [Candidatus Sumerlaeota bacterium]|nr:glycoside hydrolase family 3 C-terminal domain-containing protein [Candidatus Sumerlaeota bacterium]